MGVIKKAEIRQYLKPNETIEEAQKVIDEIEAEEPDIDTLLNKGYKTFNKDKRNSDDKTNDNKNENK